jgi:hypothetical protein
MCTAIAKKTTKKFQQSIKNYICMAHDFLLIFFCIFFIRNDRFFGVRRCNR